MKAKVVHVKHYKRGATNDDGSSMICITCRIEKKLAGRGRANQAVVTLVRVSRTGSRLPVGYCEAHVPADLEEEEEEENE